MDVAGLWATSASAYLNGGWCQGLRSSELGWELAPWAPRLIWVLEHLWWGARDVMVDRSSRRGRLQPLGLCQGRH
jgi:hypothetical protein